MVTEGKKGMNITETLRPIEGYRYPVDPERDRLVYASADVRLYTHVDRDAGIETYYVQSLATQQYFVLDSRPVQIGGALDFRG